MRGVIVSNNTSNLLFDDAFLCDLNLICLGNKKLEEILYNSYNSKKGKLVFCDKENEYVSERIPGKTRSIINKHKMIHKEKDYLDSVDVYIYEAGKSTKNILHTDAHEIFHVFSAIIPTIIEGNNNSYISNNSIYYNSMGSIGMYNNRGVHNYGIMFKETLTDILARLSLTRFNNEFDNTISSNDILKKSDSDYESYGANSGYTAFTYLTKLAIAAFSNDKDADFDNMIKNGKNIFFGRKKAPNNEKIFKNDLLYGYLANPLHIKEKWEEINGINSYDEFCSEIDNTFSTYLNTGIIDCNNLYLHMAKITEYMNKRVDHYLNIGRLSFEEALSITNNYNKVWKEVNDEYNKLEKNYKSNIFNRLKTSKTREYV